MDALPPGSSGKPALADPAVVATQLANAQLERLSTAWGTHKWGRTGISGCAMELRTQSEWLWRAKAYTYPPNAHMLFYQPTFLTIQQSSVCANKSEPLATT